MVMCHNYEFVEKICAYQQRVPSDGGMRIEKVQLLFCRLPLAICKP